MKDLKLILPRSEWPISDRTAWEAGIRPSSILDSGGPADLWRARTIEHYELAYGRWLGWLLAKTPLDREQAPASRLSPDRLRSYIMTLQQTNRPESVRNRIVGLERAITLIAPAYDREILRNACRKLPRGGDRSRKVGALQETAALVDLGIILMQRADAEAAPHHPRERAARFRDGLQIAFLAMRPLRIKNFAELELGRTFYLARGQWWLECWPEEVKNKKHILVQFPNELHWHLERYLDLYRPQLAGDRYTGQRLWVSTHYRGQWRGTIHQKIKWLTEEAFGVGLNPHLFRDAMATSLALNNPDLVNVAHVMLGNELGTTQRYYNLAQSIDASRVVARALDSFRIKSNSQTKTRTTFNRSCANRMRKSSV